MKKILKTSLYFMLIFSFIMFSGCTNENKKLAKNLDNTVTNLVYSATNLDFLSSSDLQSFTTNENTETLNINQNAENITSKNANSCENCENCYSNNQNFINNDYYKLPENAKSISNSQKEFSSKPVRKLPQNKTRTVSATSSENEKNTVTLSTDSIQTKNQELQDLISTLINKRSTLLLYINDLYKGNISVDSKHKNAINAYMNILKDNTSYFNNQKGMVSNQISQAKQAIEKDDSSALANAYIIRTDEAISTRIAKLESSISAIDSILSILKDNENSSSKSYIANNYNNNTSKQISTEKETQIENHSNQSTNQFDFSQYQGFDNTNINNENNMSEQNNITTYPPRFPYGRPGFPPYRHEFFNDQEQKIWQNENFQSNTKKQSNTQTLNDECVDGNCNAEENFQQDLTTITKETKNNNSLNNTQNDNFLENNQSKAIQQPFNQSKQERSIPQNNKSENISKNQTPIRTTLKSQDNKTSKVSSNQTLNNDCQDCENSSTSTFAENKKKFTLANSNEQNQTEAKRNEPDKTIRETQQEIEKNKDKFDKVLKQDKSTKKLSLSFLEDKNKKDRRLKTITK